jgi:hypothetical protein
LLKSEGSPRVETSEQGQIQLTISGDGGETTVKGSHLLIATAAQRGIQALNQARSKIQVAMYGLTYAGIVDASVGGKDARG